MIDISVIILIIIIIIICIYSYIHSESYNLKCIISKVDGETYCVRDRQNKKKAADLLASVATKCKQLVQYCDEKYPHDDDIKRLVNNFNSTNIVETLPNSDFTAYSENKGEKIAFCLHKKKGEKKLIDLSTLTFVAIHELAHVMTLSEGHTQEFWTNFKFLLEQAKKANIYNPVDYKNNPQPYCGIEITDNPYYDF